MAGITPGPVKTRAYEELAAWLIENPNTPFAARKLPVSEPPEVGVCLSHLNKATMRWAGGDRTTGSSKLQECYDKAIAAHGGGLLYNTPSPETGAPMGWYVFDTHARLGRLGIVGNRYDVLLNKKVEWPARPELIENGPGTARIAKPDETAAPVTAVEEAPAPVAPWTVRVTGGDEVDVLADFGDSIVIRLGGELLVCTVDKRGAMR